MNIVKEYKNNLIHLENILGDSSTDSEQLYKIGKYLFNKIFVGVFPSDQVPSFKNNQCCILNTDDSEHKGIHWCSLYKYNNKYYFYDSYNRDYKILSKNWKNKKWINANKDIDQAYTEEDCGPRSMAWLISFNKWNTKIINVI